MGAERPRRLVRILFGLLAIVVGPCLMLLVAELVARAIDPTRHVKRTVDNLYDEDVGWLLPPGESALRTELEANLATYRAATTQPATGER